MNVRDLLAKIGFTVDHKDLDKLENQLEGIKSRLEVLAAAEVVKGLFELAEKFSAVGESIHIAAASAGLTVESFQKLTYSAEQAGISQDEMQTSLARLSRSLYAARNGSAEAQEAFSKAGIGPDQIRSFHTSKDALLALADRMKAIQDPIQKAALAQQVLGRGSIRMVGYLSQGSAALKAQGIEAEQLGIILSGPQVAALKTFEEAFRKLTFVFRNFAATIASNVAPGFTFLVNDFIKFFNVNRSIIELNFTNWLFNVGYVVGIVWGAFKLLTTILIDVAKRFHLEGQIIPTIMALATLVLSMFLLGRVVKIVSSVLDTLGQAFQIAQVPMKLFWAAAGLVQKGLSYLLLELAALIDSEYLFAAATAVAEAPLWLIVAAIAALVIAGHDLYALFTGKPTWIGSFFEWIKSLDIVKASLEWIAGAWEKISGMFSAKNILPSFLQGSGLSAIFGNGNPADKVDALNNPGGSLASAAPAGNQYQINAPIDISVPPGTDPADVGKHVQNGVKEHLDRVMRETRASTLPAAVY